MGSALEFIGINFRLCVVNILCNDIVPNVARNNLTDDEMRNVFLAVNRAAYQYIISKLDDQELKTALQSYVNDNYPADNPYCSM